MLLGEPLEITSIVAGIFDSLSIRYLIGGSLASSLHGIPRATQDVDIVADLNRSHVTNFVNGLGSDFYADADMITDAIQRGKSFNIIHLSTMFKVDVFILGRDERAQEEMDRREGYQLSDGGQELFVASAEDIILEKLRWYELGERISDRQWNDVLGVIQVKNDQLDKRYMADKAIKMGIDELLKKAIDAANIR